MPTSYSTDLKIALMVTGENAGTWGDITNTNLVVIQQAIAGYESISIAGGLQTTALVMSNAALSNARNAVIKLTGTITGDQTVTVPAGIEKTWIVSNGTTGTHTVEFKPVGGTGATWSTTDKGIKILYSDGTNITTADLSSLSGTVATAQIANYAVNTAQLATNAVTAIKITQSTITQAKLAANSVAANQIVQSTITQSKLAANSVGSNQLISTGVTAASYTSASITVDADGRITAASSGAAGGIPATLPTLIAVGPTSGTYSASPTANRLGVYLYAGGGAGTPLNNGPGGGGGFGFWNAPITQPFTSKPFSVGAGGNAGPPSSGSANAGGSTNLTCVGTANGGAGGSGNSQGASGNAPGAVFSGGASWPSSARSFTSGGSYGAAGGAGGTMCNYQPGSGGSSGILIVFENTGA
jgi:hypothetical protein